MLAFDALVQGRVMYQGPQGGRALVRRGRCAVQSYQGFVSISWHEDGEEASAVLTAPYFESCLEGGAIVIIDAAQIRDRPAPARSVSTARK